MSTQQAPVSVREALKQSDAVVGLVKDIRKLMFALRHSSALEAMRRSNLSGTVRDSGLGSNGKLIRHYLETHQIRKLQIGAGVSSLDGWLSTDIEPRFKTTAYLDATKRFPFEDGTFDYVFSEHMIEHMPWKDGLFMLRESFRVLKPGGAIRVATPDLKVLLDLYKGAHTPVQEKYIRWITDKHLDGLKIYKPAFVINNAFRNWGHQFLYDTELMTMSLGQTGFEDVRQWPIGECDDPHLQGIEFHGKTIADTEVAAFETMVFAAKRPLGGTQ